MSYKEEKLTFTYETRLNLDQESSELLNGCATLFSQIERLLFAEIAAGKPSESLKSEYLEKYDITARHFNAIDVQLEGKISSIKELRKLQIITLKEKIDSSNKCLERLKNAGKIYQKKRLINKLECKLRKLESDQEQGKIPLCFGSRRLFNAQFYLKANGYNNHDEWKKDWEASRNSSFFLLGSKDESGGNQSCCAFLGADGKLTLRIRLPNKFIATHGKYLVIPNVYFKYGHEVIKQALKSAEERKRLMQLKDPEASRLGTALSYRFKRDEKGWRVFVSLSEVAAPIETSKREGVIGIDVNVDHLAIVETDRFGNPIFKESIPLNTYGKSQHQAKALIGDACAAIVEIAKNKGKDVVVENLDFSKKKTQLKQDGGPKYARMLSSFSYSSIKNNIKRRAWKRGVNVAEVNPAFTSLIGRVKFAKRYGLSVHHAAALTIGRRYMEFSERVPRHLDAIPDGKGNYIALSVPVRNRTKHVWSVWRRINREFQTVLAAHIRARNRSSSRQNTPVIAKIPNVDGGIPARESLTSLFSQRD